MNNLNSILIEGEIAGIQAIKNGRITFTVKSNHLYKDGSKLVKKVNHFTVGAAGKVAERLATRKKGDKLRVVGRLDTEGNAVFIEAEHIEVRAA